MKHAPDIARLPLPMRAHCARTVDVAILGGGPGGAACALTAASEGLSVALFEPQLGAFDKPCGEGILPEGVRALEWLGAREIRSLGQRFETIRYCIDGIEPLSVPLPEPGLALMRPTLMAILDAELACTSAVVRHAVNARAERDDDAFAVVGADQGFTRARALVIADGAGGHGAPWLRGPRPEPPEAANGGRCGARARFENESGLAEVEVHFGETCELYLTPLPDGLINAAALFDRVPRCGCGSHGLLEHALEQHGSARHHLGLRVSQPEARRLHHPPPRHTSDGDSFLVGDAGGGIDPILGCGLSIAVRSGIHAGRCVRARLDGLSHSRVAQVYERFYAREVVARRALAAVLRQAARHPTAARALARVARSSSLVTRALMRVAAGERAAG